jgi:hypothetical protein
MPQAMDILLYEERILEDYGSTNVIQRQRKLFNDLSLCYRKQNDFTNAKKYL